MDGGMEPHTVNTKKILHDLNILYFPTSQGIRYVGSCRILSTHRGCPNIIHETQIEAADLSTPSFPTPNWQNQVKIVIVADFGQRQVASAWGEVRGGGALETAAFFWGRGV